MRKDSLRFLKRCSVFSVFIFLATVFVILNVPLGAQPNYDHDLSIEDAQNISVSDPTGWRSPDIKIGSAFDDLAGEDIIRRGIGNDVYVRFNINGVADYTLASGRAKIYLHYRIAGLSGPEPFTEPPPLSDPSWQSMGEKLVTYTPTDGLFSIGRVWPDGFASVSPKYVPWTAPNVADEFFHIRTEVVYLDEGGIDAPSMDENPADNVAISLYESLSGLIDIVLVHDISGSMGYYMYEGFSYMDHAKARAAGFLPELNPDDRFAVVAFSGSGSGSSDVWPSPAVLQLATPGNIGLANAAIASLGDGGVTPMGAGIQRAIDLLIADEPERKKVILLLSDGYENSGALRACGGADPAAPCVGESILSQLQTNNIRVFSMALGTAAWIECLDCLATQSGGQWYASPDPGIDLANVYLDMQQDYTMDDLYAVDIGESGGGDDVYATQFEGLDEVLHFILSWDDLDAKLALELKPPGGNWIDPRRMKNATLFAGRGYSVARIEPANAGEWGYRVVGDDAKRYLAAVRSQRVGVRLALGVNAEGVVGEAIKINARVSDRGRPLTDAKLHATVTLPAETSLNTHLRALSRDYILKNKMIPIDTAKLKQNPDATRRMAFFDKISQGNPHTLNRTRSVSVALEHVGEGVYSAVMDKPVDIAGVYQVNVKYSEDGIERTQTRSVVLSPAPIDYSRSRAEILQIKQVDEPAAWLLRVYPADRYGNAIIDAGLSDQIKADIDGGHLDKAPGIVFDSALQQQLVVAADQTPKLRAVSVGDRKLKLIGEGEGEEPDDDEKDPMLIILLIVFILVVAWLVYRSRKKGI